MDTTDCIYCHGEGFYRDDLSGGESYCTCPHGDALKAREAKLNKAHGRKLSDEEAAEVRRKLGID